MKKLLAFLLAASLMITALVMPASAAEVKEAGSPMKIGVILTFTENGYGLTVKQYLNAIGEDLNVEFQYAAAQEAEAILEALENYAAAEMDGVIVMPTFNTVEEVELCEESGMYYTICGSAIMNPEVYDAVKGNPYFAGAVGNDDAASTYGMCDVLVNQYGVKKLGLISLPAGTSDMHDGRYAGVMQAKEEFGFEEYEEALAYNLTESSQNMVAQYPELDAIIALAGGIEECMQPIITAGKQDTMKFAGFREEAGAEDLFETGALATLGVGTPINTIFAFINLYNAITGNTMVPAEGEKCNFLLDTIYVSNAEDYLAYVGGAMSKNPYTMDQIKEHIVAFNPEANFEAFAEFMKSYNLDYLKANQ